MAKRDVELVIRAKDEAGKAVESIAAALRDLVKAQDTVAKSAGRTDSTLARLGSALKGLDSQFRGLSASQKIASEMDKARTAADRLETGVAKLREESRSYAADAAHAVAGVTQMTQALRANESVLQGEQTLLAQLGASHRNLNKAISDATARRAQLSNQEDRLVKQIATASAGLQSATERWQRYSQQVEAAAAPSNTLVDRAVRASKAIGTQDQKLASLNDRLRATKEAIAFVSSIQGAYVADLQKTAAAYERQKAVVDALAVQHKTLATAVTEAANRQSELQRSADVSAASLKREETSLAQMRTELAGLEAESKKATANMEQLAQVAGNLVTQAVNKQRQAMHAAERAYSGAADDLVKFRQALAGVSEPTTKMVADLGQLEQTADRLKRTFDIQRAALIEMVQAQRSAGTDLTKLASLEERFQGITRQVAAEVNALGGALRKSAGETRTIVPPVQQASTFVERLRASLISFSGTTAPISRGVRSISQAILGIGTSSRAALTWTQRLRAEVLSLVSAYIGIFSVLRLFNSLVDTLRTVEAASSRLNAVFDNDFGQVNRELEFLRRNAERLGFQFGVLADEYTKFAVAAKVANFANETTRKIFISVIEAARVNKLGIDQVRGALLALQQMISKGKVTSEELRRQLGDRLPGAFQLMAKAVGVTTAELDKMLKTGELFANEDTLTKFANTLDEEFGTALPKSLETTTTAIGRWTQAMFEAFKRIGKAGFNEAFKDLLDTLTELAQSAQGASALDKIGRILGGLLHIVEAVVKNIDILIIALGSLAGAKAAGAIIQLTRIMSGFAASLIPAQRGLFTVGTSFRTAAASAGIFTGAITAARGALTLLLSSTGIGLAVAAVGTLLGYWLTRTDAATAALEVHKKQVDAVLNAYQKVDGEIARLKDNVEGLTFAEAVKNGKELERQFAKSLKEIARTAADNSFGRTLNSVLDETVHDADLKLRELTRAFVDSGGKGVDTFIRRLDELARAAGNEKFTELVVKVQEAAQGFRESAIALDENQAIIATLGDNLNEAARGVRALDTASPFNRMDDSVQTLDEHVRVLTGRFQELAGTTELVGRSIPTVTDAVDRSEAIIKKLKDSVDLADLSYSKFLNRLKGSVTPQQAIQSYRDLTKLLQNVGEELRKMAKIPQEQATQLNLLGVDTGDFEKEIQTILQGFDGTVKGAQQVKDALDKLAAQQTNDFLRDYILGIETFIDEKGDLIDAADKMGLAVKALAGDVRDSALAQEAIKTGNPFGDTTESAKAAAEAVKKLEQQMSQSGKKIVTTVDATGRAWTRVGNTIRRATQAEADLARQRNDLLQTEGQGVNALGQSWIKQGGIIRRAVGAAGNVIVQMDDGIKRVGDSTQEAADSIRDLQGTDLNELKQNIDETGKSIASLGAASKDTFDTLASAAVAFLDALAMLRDAFSAFTSDLMGVGQTVDATWTDIVTQGQTAAASLTSAFTDFGDFLVRLWAGVRDEATQSLEAIRQLAGVGIDFTDIGSAAVATFEQIVQAATDQLPLVAQQFEFLKTKIFEILSFVVGRAEQLWSRMATDTRSAFQQVAATIESTFATLEANVGTILSRIERKLSALKTKIDSVASSVGAESSVPGRAAGGRILGRGSGTSDSAGIFALSRDEFVLRAKAARRVGYRFLNWLNEGGDLRGMVPGFAGGGRVDGSSSPSFDFGKLFDGLSARGALSGLRPIYLQMPNGDTVGPVYGDNQVVGSMVRVANRAKVTSVGRTASYVK